MVAKSFQNLPLLSKPFEEKGKMYVLIQKKDGKERKVRWYTEKEYKKMYGDSESTSQEKRFGPQKECLGYAEGYIWVFNNFNREDAVLRSSLARYAEYCGWYLPSNKPISADLPSAIKLYWDDVGDSEGYLVEEKIQEWRKRCLK